MVIPDSQLESSSSSKRPATNRARKMAKKMRRDGPPTRAAVFALGPEVANAKRLIQVDGESLLTDRERKLINELLFSILEEHGTIEVKLLDHRFWEVRRRCGWDPDAHDEPHWANAKPFSVFEWWCELDPETREELAVLSRGIGMLQ
jgi:hypothetical protein